MKRKSTLSKTKMDADSPKSMVGESAILPEPCDSHVTGVEASAGGLEAIVKFFPSDAVRYWSSLRCCSTPSTRLQKSHRGTLGVKNVSGDQTRDQPATPRANTIRLIPPNAEMVIADG